MATTIKCPKCGNQIEITEAIQKDLEEKLINEIQTKHNEELKKLQQEKQAEVEEIKLKTDKQIEEAKNLITETAQAEAREKIAIELKDRDDQINELKKRAEKAEEQELKIRKEKRDLEESKRKFEIEKQRQLDEEREEIRNTALIEAQENHALKDQERDKVINDLQKALADAQRKAQQGSQQIQGEVQELALEDVLKKIFPFDEIKEVPKGVKGADIIQAVCNSNGSVCGTIVWESKNTKAWSAAWIQKLKEDQRSLKAEIAVLVSKVLPETIKNLSLENGVYVCDISSAVGLAHALRQHIIGVNAVCMANQGKANKAEIVYDYLISNDFKRRIEVWVEYFRNRKDEINKERAYFNKKWEKEEKSIIKVIENTAGIYGDLQGLIGNALPKVPYLELPEDTINN